MPPTPELAVTLLEEKLEAWCYVQNVSVPTVRIHYKAKASSNAGYDVCLGSYASWLKEINLYVKSDALAQAEGQRLLYVTRALNATFLHELRHHWQYETWSAERIAADQLLPYAKRKIEIDANEFAAAYRDKLTLLRVKRSFGGGRISGFGRLTAAQEGARQ